MDDKSMLISDDSSQDVINKKYILTDDAVYVKYKRNGEDVKVPLYRIKAVINFGDVKKGDLGGFVEREENLSHRGDCRIYDNACVYDEARISGNTKVGENAQVYGDAKISGEAQVYGSALVYGDSKVSDKAQVCGMASVCDKTVSGDTIIAGDTPSHADSNAVSSSESTTPSAAEFTDNTTTKRDTIITDNTSEAIDDTSATANNSGNDDDALRWWIICMAMAALFGFLTWMIFDDVAMGVSFGIVTVVLYFFSSSALTVTIINLIAWFVIHVLSSSWEHIINFIQEHIYLIGIIVGSFLA